MYPPWLRAVCGSYRGVVVPSLKGNDFTAPLEGSCLFIGNGRGAGWGFNPSDWVLFAGAFQLRYDLGRKAVIVNALYTPVSCSFSVIANEGAGTEDGIIRSMVRVFLSLGALFTLLFRVVFGAVQLVFVDLAGIYRFKAEFAVTFGHVEVNLIKF